jgi:hypothetical protein
MALSVVALIAVSAWGQLWAEPQKARIVGLGAATCQQFNDDIKSNPAVRRDYLAWAQGFMSGILLGRPPGVDEGSISTPGLRYHQSIGFLGGSLRGKRFGGFHRRSRGSLQAASRGRQDVISKLHAKHPQDKTLQPQGPDTLAGRVPQPKIYYFYISLGR